MSFSFIPLKVIAFPYARELACAVSTTYFSLASRMVDPALSNRPETRWRVLALLARVDSQYVGRAREALEQLQRKLQEPFFTTYLARPDIRKLAWPLTHWDRANQ
jgi:hypothetical protein